jgi:hypothetical protein
VPLRYLQTLVIVTVLLVSPLTGTAETPAPSVHWGALSFPDHERTVDLGLTVNRFTEFNRHGDRYNAIEETAGFNFASLTWTERWARLPGWTTNLTLGGGPTDDKFSRFLQNDLVHKVLGLEPVPVAAVRGGTDVMLNGSLTRWFNLFGSADQGFIGVGAATGTLYHEPYVNAGIRRLALSDVAGSWGGSSKGLEDFSNFVRFSVMGRYGRIFRSGAYDELARQSYFGQASMSIADYRNEEAEPPRWELEIGLAIDSGLFADRAGQGIEGRFITVAIRIPYLKWETWNDIGGGDYGPTFGARLMIDLLQVYHRFKKPT